MQSLNADNYTPYDTLSDLEVFVPLEEIDVEDFQEQETRKFTIDNDDAADWAVRKIAQDTAERDRLLTIAENQIKDIVLQMDAVKKKCETSVSFLTAELSNYFDKVPHKETKTAASYQLFSGKLKFKKPTVRLVPDDKALVAWLEKSGTGEYIKVTKKPAWADIKKQLQVVDGKVIIADTGEIVEGVNIEQVPAQFAVEPNKKEAAQ